MCHWFLQQMYCSPAETHKHMTVSRLTAIYNLGIHFVHTSREWVSVLVNTWKEGVPTKLFVACCHFLLLIMCDKRKLILWSNSCCDQNKKVITVSEANFLRSVWLNHKFLVKEHTYMLCYREFALIEKVKKLSTPPPDVQMHLIRITAEANMKNPFIIIVSCFVWKSLTYCAIATMKLRARTSAIRLLAEICISIQDNILKKIVSFKLQGHCHLNETKSYFLFRR
jgi:hypothetical protein